MMQTVEFRPMLPTDLDAVMRVETAAYEFPWTKGIFADCIRVGYDCVVGTHQKRIIAHAVLTVAVGESHILNLATHPDNQGQGVGKQLLLHLISRARIKSAESILLEARPSNKAAIHLYESVGFNEIGCRKAYYPAPDGKEDALLFALQL
jgi:ribosomal-protein-alanine N-acetyltransferase